MSEQDNLMKEAANQIRVLREALLAAEAFINSHAADPDITDEMCRTYADYQKAMKAFYAP